MRAEDTEGNISIGDATKIDPEDSKNLMMRAIQSFQEYLVQTLGYRRPREKNTCSFNSSNTSKRNPKEMA